MMNDNLPAPRPSTAVVSCGHKGAILRPDSYVMELYGRVEWVVQCEECDWLNYQDV